jgi:tetratricopeptide (TPR) repeat protein
MVNVSRPVLLSGIAALAAVSPLLAADKPAKQPPSQVEIEALRDRFRQGVVLMSQGSNESALKIFNAILDTDPNARGSLLMAGIASNQLGNYLQASDYFDRFLALEPKNSAGLIGAIKANQALNLTPKVDTLRERLVQLRKEGKDIKLNRMISYERQRIPLPGGTGISILESFDDSNAQAIWSFNLIGPENKLIRRIELISCPEEFKGQPDASPFMLAEPVYEGEIIARYKIIEGLQEMPSYEPLRNKVVKMLEATPKPAASAATPAPAPSPAPEAPAGMH